MEKEQFKSLGVVLVIALLVWFIPKVIAILIAVMGIGLFLLDFVKTDHE